MKLPERIFGIETKDAYARRLKELDKVPETVVSEQKPVILTPASVNRPESYIILPSHTHGSYGYHDTLVSMEKSHHGKNWTQAHEALHQEGAFMLTIRQYVDFINLLKSGTVYDGRGKQIDAQRVNAVLDEILTVRSPWRSEWLDAQCSTKKSSTIPLVGRKDWQIIYHVAEQNGNLKEVQQPLEDCLRSDKTPGISLDAWLQDATAQGLPKPNVGNGSLYYWYPQDGMVARFVARSGRADLGCNGYPQDSNPDLGVRASCVKK